jgi:hypothetical protein
MSKPSSYTGRMMSLLTILKQGESFHTEVRASIVLQYAKAEGVEVTTESVIQIDEYKSAHPRLSKLTKVTII